MINVSPRLPCPRSIAANRKNQLSRYRTLLSRLASTSGYGARARCHRAGSQPVPRIQPGPLVRLGADQRPRLATARTAPRRASRLVGDNRQRATVLPRRRWKVQHLHAGYLYRRRAGVIHVGGPVVVHGALLERQHLAPVPDRDHAAVLVGLHVQLGRAVQGAALAVVASRRGQALLRRPELIHLPAEPPRLAVSPALALQLPDPPPAFRGH